MTDKKQIAVACEGADAVPIDSLTEFQGELKTLSEEAFTQLAAEVVATGIAFPVKVWRDGDKQWIMGGTQTTRVLRELRDKQGYRLPKIPIVWIHAKDREEAARRVLQDVTQYGRVEGQGLYQFMVDHKITMDEMRARYRPPEIKLELFEAEYFGNPTGGSGAGGSGGDARPSLSDRFVVPPFSVLDTRQGYWQERKRRWLALGIQSEVGRGNANLSMAHPATTATIDFCAQKRAIEADLGRDLPTDEAKNIMAERGSLKDSRSANRQKFASGPARKPAQDLMRGEHTVGQTSRRAADQRSNVTGAPPMPDYADIGMENMAPGTSIFDPVLCELAYRWFCPSGGTVIDPFSGGSVRGVVAALLGRQYVGVDLREEQVQANRDQWGVIATRLNTGAGAGTAPGGGSHADPVWHAGDSVNIVDYAKDVQADLLFTCPPYADLEVYGDDPRDLSTMPYDQFIAAYGRILAAAASLLRPDRFACIVVGDIRDKKGIYRNFVSHTIAAMEAAGLRLYNEAILVNQIGSLPLRAGRAFSASRKLGKCHQNVLVFCKGDPKKATAACGAVDVQLPEVGDDVQTQGAQAVAGQ